MPDKESQQPTELLELLELQSKLESLQGSHKPNSKEYTDIQEMLAHARRLQTMKQRSAYTLLCCAEN